MLDELYFGDERLILTPIEHLSPAGISKDLAEAVAARREDGGAIVALLNRALPLYWERSQALAGNDRYWPAPRIRNIAIVDNDTAIPPYVQLLNTSTWTLFDCDFDPATSSTELVAYLLAHGDRMSVTGEATMAAVRNAAYWFDRTDQEVADFQRGARATVRPDAAAFHALADAIPWLRELHHERLRPPAIVGAYRPIPNTGLLIARADERRPADLVARWTKVAKGCVATYLRSYDDRDPAALGEVLDWLRDESPPLLVAGQKNRILWDPEHADRVGGIRNQLRNAGGPVQRSILADLRTIAHHSRAFAELAGDRFADLPEPGDDIGQDGYTYLYRGRKILAYNLHEPHLERLKVPALPYARAMLGARALHEWCHLAVDAGWVQAAGDLTTPVADLAACFDDVIAAAEAKMGPKVAADLDELRRAHPESSAVDLGGETIAIPGDGNGAAILRMLLPRVADFKANLLASPLQALVEREAYVRQNIRTLRGEYPADAVWRMFARYVYELQYLRFSEVEDKREYFFRSTWFDRDFLDSGLVSAEALDTVDHCFARLVNVFSVKGGPIG